MSVEHPKDEQPRFRSVRELMEQYLPERSERERSRLTDAGRRSDSARRLAERMRSNPRGPGG